MNTPSLWKELVAVVAVATLTLLPAQPSTIAPRGPAPLGLLRLPTEAKPGQAPTLTTDKYAVDDLTTSAVAGASRVRREGVDMVTLDDHKKWSRPLRGSRNLEFDHRKWINR